MGVTAYFYAIHWTSWRQEHPDRMPDVDWLHDQAILTEELEVTPVHRAWLRALPTRRGDNRRWFDILDADSVYCRCRPLLSEADRAALDPLMDALLCPGDGAHQPIAYGDHHMLYPPELIAQIRDLEADLAPIEAVMPSLDLSDLRTCGHFSAFEQVTWEWLDLFERVQRQGPEWGMMVWVWV